MATIFEKFTNLYPVSKTLRFELVPVGHDGKRLSENDAKSIFAKIIEQDRKIHDAYVALKPVMDKIHEEVITESLISTQAQKINFAGYLDKYRQRKDLDSEEISLRDSIVKTFNIGVQSIKHKAGNDSKGQPVLKKEGVKCLKEAAILKYVQVVIGTLEDEKEKNELEAHLAIFRKFFTYFSGYNQNRENYYEKEGKATAVATRIVNDNLPKFCDNCIQFSDGKVQKKNKRHSNTEEKVVSRKDEYLNAYQYLKNADRDTLIKDAKTNEMIEAYTIDEQMFEISKFSTCLSQAGIDDYNRIIGHYNLLINLYNQARKDEEGFKKLFPFKTLYKQIGCGVKKSVFHALKYDTREQQDAKEKTDEILNLKEILCTISTSGQKYFGNPTQEANTINIHRVINWLKQTNNCDGIYWSKAALDKISDTYFANWHSIKDRLLEGLQSKDKNVKDDYTTVASYNKKREEQLKINDAVELSGLFKVLDKENEKGWCEAIFKKSVLEDRQSLIDEALTPSQNLINLICADMEDLAKEFSAKSASIMAIKDYKNEENITQIKVWLDTAKSIIWLIKYFDVKESKVKGNALNPELANMLSVLLRADDAKWFDWYDGVRNYLTKKPQDDAKENKLKLNFDYGNLMNGFVDSYTDSDNATQYGGYLFRINIGCEGRTDYEYYLGISKNSRLFRCHLKDEIRDSDKSKYERLDYYQAKSTTYFDDKYSKNKLELIKIVESAIDEYAGVRDDAIKRGAEEIKKRDKKGEITPSKLFDRIKKKKEFAPVLESKSILSLVNQTIQDLQISCNNFKERAQKLEDVQNKQYSGVDGYKQIIEDLQEISKENKAFQYFNVSKKEFDSAFNDLNKQLHLFKISNKDLSYSETSQTEEKGKKKRDFKGTENLHTFFFRALMREQDQITNIDLGKGEIFFREKAITDDKIFFHPANKPIYRRSDGKAESRFSHKIIKDKRFTEDKYHLHLSITLNFNPETSDVTGHVNEYFTVAEDIQFLGIDRGEKHLIYYSLVDAGGKIIEQGHFDIINKKNYLQEINEAARKRRIKQENWQQKGNIKNLKDGYISLVIHEIIQKMKDRNGKFKPTFIVLEDLNTGFKRSRQKFEQQVYQKFELALAKKLNYLVDKNTPVGEIGSVAKALQLTPPVATYQDIENRKQLGIMLYTRANYTSVTDPVTGWRKTIYLTRGKDIDKQIFKIFSEIKMDERGDYFFQYTDEKTGKIWILWSGENGKSLERYRARRGKDKYEWIVEPFLAKEMLDQLFSNFDKNQSLLAQLKDGKTLLKINNKDTAWESLRFTIDIIQQIRNSGDVSKGQDDNYLLSPVRNEQGKHFDSRKYQNLQNPDMPKDADANGAYNIARKGIVMYEHIRQWIKDGKPKFKKTTDLDLFISDKEWDLWTTSKKQWREDLKSYASKQQKEKTI